VEPQKRLHYRACSYCCPDAAMHERDPNEPFLKDFKTRESYGRVWVNGFYCSNGAWVEGHWHFLDEDKPAQASNPEPETSTPPLNSDDGMSLEVQYSTTMISEGHVWVKPYYTANGRLVPGHWRKLKDDE
jgi:hypothetical protein